VVIEGKVTAGDVGDSALLEFRPGRLFDGRSDLCDLVGGGLASPVGLDDLFDFSVCTDAGETKNCRGDHDGWE